MAGRLSDDGGSSVISDDVPLWSASVQSLHFVDEQMGRQERPAIDGLHRGPLVRKSGFLP